MKSTTCSIPLFSDPVLPQRDLLLDADFMTVLFARELGVSRSIIVDHCDIFEPPYHARESLRVAYRVSACGRSCVVAGRAFRKRQPEVL